MIDQLRAQDISQNDLAERMGVSKARISQLLSSNANPTVKLVARVCKALDLNVVYSPIDEGIASDFVTENNQRHNKMERLTPDWLSAAKYMGISSEVWGCIDNYGEIRSQFAVERA